MRVNHSQSALAIQPVTKTVSPAWLNSAGASGVPKTAASVSAGSRATIAASLLLRDGFEQVDLYLGSFAAWSGQGLALEE